jgi:hypothetical protein
LGVPGAARTAGVLLGVMQAAGCRGALLPALSGPQPSISLV